MSTPVNGEYGDWYPDPAPSSYPYQNKMLNGYGDLLISNHKKDFDEAKKYTLAEQDDVLKKIAVNNIKSHPGKFISKLYQQCRKNSF